ncbi:hypothetical protein TNCT_94641 [Trichonephila clavata]|uniref:Uncharacterized protein n=1 Tax=Trichonephila clavata TaxID=2740835 RepID=A0A8X6KK87_TRICU|nr:hypothetical protein TNCT_94641 [Trichonephila clavata]
MLMSDASSANKEVDVAKEAVLFFPGKILQYYKALKIILRTDCKQNTFLNLWRTHKIDTSLAIRALGVLMNYGILTATFSGTAVSYLELTGMVKTSASSANKVADVAREAVVSLPGKIPQYYDELKSNIEEIVNKTFV